MGLRDYVLAPYRAERVTLYAPRIPAMAALSGLRIAVVSDIHAAQGFMPRERIARIIAKVQALEPHLILFPGDFFAEATWFQTPLSVADLLAELQQARAPLGCYASFGNHDWWLDPESGTSEGTDALAARFEAQGLPVLRNQVRKLVFQGAEFWLAGLDSQAAFHHIDPARPGPDRLDAVLDQITDDAPVLLMAHEPGIFAHMPERVALTVSGHTHAGQVRLFGRTPVLPSHTGPYVYGAFQRGAAHLIVSAGLGCSKAPLRLGVVPEIVLITL